MFGTFSVIGTSKVIHPEGFSSLIWYLRLSQPTLLLNPPDGHAHPLVSAYCVLTQMPASLLSCPSIQYIMCSMNASWPVELRILLLVRTDGWACLYISARHRHGSSPCVLVSAAVPRVHCLTRASPTPLRCHSSLRDEACDLCLVADHTQPTSRGL
jgi:hypothetical protein